VSGDGSNGPSISLRVLTGWLVLAAAGCALPDYAKVEDGENPATKKDSGEPSAPSCSMDLVAKGECRSCIAEHCCDQAAACKNGACGEGLEFPITPLMSVSEKFDALATCMLENCDTEDTCDVSWGCVGKYRWPASKENHKFNMRVFNYADPREVGIPNIDIKLCESSDPSCSNEGGTVVATSVTDSSGNADFTAPRGLNGYFQLEGGGPAPATVQWNKPVYTVVDTFTHQALQQRAVQQLAVVSGYHSSLEEPFKPGTGFMIARAHNCLPLRYLEAPNTLGRARDVKISFTPSSGASRVYYINDMAMLDLPLGRTSSRGYAGAFEVLDANVTVTATHADTDKMLATGTITIREGTIGFMYLMPDTGI